MIDGKTNFVEGLTISDIWREVMWLCVKNGYDFVVKHGSYVGQIRRQLEDVKIRIYQPWLRPLAPIMPPGLPQPTTDEKIEKYFLEYLMSDELKENEQYTYGTYIKRQLPRVIEILRQSEGNSNQACITVGDNESINLPDPPCLKVVSFKVVDKHVNMSVFFRSWDLFVGLPENLGGLQMVKEYVLAHLDDLGIKDGKLIAYSDGLHLYEQYFDLVNVLNVDKVKVETEILKDKEEFAKTLLDGREEVRK